MPHYCLCQGAPRVEALVDGLLDDLAARGGTVDLIEDFAYPLPVTVICEMMGVPTEDHATFADWSRILAASIDPDVLRGPEPPLMHPRSFPPRPASEP